MDLVCEESTLCCDTVSTLVWDRDELVDVTSGQRFPLDGANSQRTWISLPIKNGEVKREINRSYYFAASGTGDYLLDAGWF